MSLGLGIMPAAATCWSCWWSCEHILPFSLGKSWMAFGLPDQPPCLSLAAIARLQLTPCKRPEGPTFARGSLIKFVTSFGRRRSLCWVSSLLIVWSWNYYTLLYQATKRNVGSKTRLIGRPDYDTERLLHSSPEAYLDLLLHSIGQKQVTFLL